MARDPVLQWAADAAAAERATGIPASVLLGLTRIESGGREGLTSSAGAGGLTQFMPGTAREYDVDVRPGHARSQLLGAGRYLKALGFEKDPEYALAAYNGGPGNANIPETRAYAGKVLAAARSYVSFDGGGKGAGAEPNPISQPAPAPASPGQLTTPAQHNTLVQFGVTAALVLAGVLAMAVGVGRATGVRSPLAGAS